MRGRTYRLGLEVVILPLLALFVLIWALCQSSRHRCWRYRQDAGMYVVGVLVPVTKQRTSFCCPTAVEIPSCREPW